MRSLVAIPFAVLAACTVSAGPQVETSPEAEARLQEALAGRTAGAPVACLQQREIRGRRAIDEQTILFDATGGLVYVNRTRTACAGLRSWHALRTRTLGTSVCEGDLVVPFDSTSGIEVGGCTLGQFTPYRRAG